MTLSSATCPLPAFPSTRKEIRGNPLHRADVFPNPSHSAADGIPYVVVTQSGLLDALSTWLTMPLAELDAAIKVPTALCPVIVVKGKRLHALAHYAAPLPAKSLRRAVDNVSAQSSAWVSAMDVVVSGV
jgi:toxin CcdB